MENMVRLPLEKAYNVRELGGYCTGDKKVTAWHRFLRSDAVDKLTEGDVSFLKEYGLKTVIDLRSDEEAERDPDVFVNNNEIDYYHLPLMTEQVDDVTINADSFHIELKSFYLALLKETNKIKKIMDAIAMAKEGCILFHCTAGKDRTGIIAMLLLGLANVNRTDIIANYEISYTILSANPNLKFDPSRTDISVIFSKPETISACLDYITENFQDIFGYLYSCGVSTENITKIKQRLF